jgi:hypothetical protein
MGKAQVTLGGLSEKDMARFKAVRDRAAKIGVRDINFSGTKDSLECYERTLNIIEKNKARYDRNAEET